MTRKRTGVPTDQAEFVAWLDAVILRYEGPADELESAIGMVVLARHVGWKALRLVHTSKTIAKYEAILGIVIRNVFPAEGPASSRSRAVVASREISNFWKVVSGDTDIGLTRSERRWLDL